MTTTQTSTGKAADVAAYFKVEAQKNAVANHNKELAVELARAGIPVLLCKQEDKQPMPIAWQFLDATYTHQEIEAKRGAFFDMNGFEPLHVGCTLDTKLIRKWFREHPTAVPAISCGAAGLLVIDNDIKVRNGVLRNGVELFDAFCAPHGGMPDGAFSITSQGKGRHVYFRADEVAPLGCSPGILKKECESDVKAFKGYVIAPGTIRGHDLRSYGTKADLKAFIRAYKAGQFAPVPQFIRDAIGTKPEGTETTVTAEQWAQPLKDLAEKDWPEYADTFGEPALGAKYDVEALKQKDSEFREVIESPTGNRSDDRWTIARRLSFLCRDMLVEELATFYGEHADIAGQLTDDGKGQGNYSHTDIAKEWTKNRIAVEKGNVKTPASNGEVFGAIEDESGDEDVSPEVQAKRDAGRKEWMEMQARIQCKAEQGDGDQSTSDESTGSQSSDKPPRSSYIADIRKAELRLLDWAVKFFIARGTTSIVSGKWGAGKTAVFADIALHVAHGLSYRGCKVKKGVVVYVALENAEDVERRVRAWCDKMEREGHDLSKGAFVMHRGPCRLYDERGKATADEKALIEIAEDAEEHYGLPVSMVIIDTLSQSIIPGNDREDGSIFVAAMQRVANGTGANVTALHHPTKAGEAVRGDSALQGNVDTIIDVARDEGGRGTIKAGSKFRIGNPAKINFSYRLKAFEIGKDDDGDIVDVVLAVEANAAPAMGAVEDDSDDATLTPPDAPADKLAATLRVFKERVERLSDATGEPAGKIGLTAKEIFAALNVDRRASGLPEIKDRTVVSRLLGRLVEGGEIVKSGDNRRTEYRL